MVFKNKKGIIFTILALVISSFILILFFYLFEAPIDKEVEVTKIKIHKVNKLLNQIEDVARTKASISSRASIDYLINEMHRAQTHLSDFDNNFGACLNGSAFCGNSANFSGWMSNEFSSFLNKNLGINVAISVSDFVISQNEPWLLVISFNLSVLINEYYYATWKINEVINQSFSIIGLRDPVYAVRPSNSVIGTFEEVNIIKFDSVFYSLDADLGWQETSSDFNRLVLQKKYFEHAGSPSYLDRLKNNTSSSALGIVSFVLPDTVSEIYGDTDMDWVFWNNLSIPYDVGSYDFSMLPYVEKLRILRSINLEESIHGLRIPTSIADKVKLNDSSYFT